MYYDAHLLFVCHRARCFLSLQWQPRLAIITSTLQALCTRLLEYVQNSKLQATTVDLTHFLIAGNYAFCAKLVKPRYQAASVARRNEQTHNVSQRTTSAKSRSRQVQPKRIPFTTVSGEALLSHKHLKINCV